MKWLISYVMCGIFVIALIWVINSKAEVSAQDRPFRVYETGGACVYITGGGGGPVDLEVIPRNEWKGC